MASGLDDGSTGGVGGHVPGTNGIGPGTAWLDDWESDPDEDDEERAARMRFVHYAHYAQEGHPCPDCQLDRLVLICQECSVLECSAERSRTCAFIRGQCSCSPIGHRSDDEQSDGEGDNEDGGVAGALELGDSDEDLADSDEDLVY